MAMASAPLLHPRRNPSCASEETLLIHQGTRQHPPFHRHALHTFHGPNPRVTMKGKCMSQPVTFEPGVHYVLQGVGYQVVQLLDDGMLVARNLTTNAHITHRL